MRVDGRRLCLLTFVVTLIHEAAGDWSQTDCQENELYVRCGRCEATCEKPVVECKIECQPNRCECVVKRGYVRSKHGYCIKYTECPGPNIYALDPDKGRNAMLVTKDKLGVPQKKKKKSKKKKHHHKKKKHHKTTEEEEEEEEEEYKDDEDEEEEEDDDDDEVEGDDDEEEEEEEKEDDEQDDEEEEEEKSKEKKKKKSHRRKSKKKSRHNKKRKINRHDDSKDSKKKSDEGKNNEGKSDEGKSDEGRSDEGKSDEGKSDEKSMALTAEDIFKNAPADHPENAPKVMVIAVTESTTTTTTDTTTTTTTKMPTTTTSSSRSTPTTTAKPTTSTVRSRSAQSPSPIQLLSSRLQPNPSTSIREVGHVKHRTSGRTFIRPPVQEMPPPPLPMPFPGGLVFAEEERDVSYEDLFDRLPPSNVGAQRPRIEWIPRHGV